MDPLRADCGLRLRPGNKPPLPIWVFRKAVFRNNGNLMIYYQDQAKATPFTCILRQSVSGRGAGAPNALQVEAQEILQLSHLYRSSFGYEFRLRMAVCVPSLAVKTAFLRATPSRSRSLPPDGCESPFRAFCILTESIQTVCSDFVQTRALMKKSPDSITGRGRNNSSRPETMSFCPRPMVKESRLLNFKSPYAPRRAILGFTSPGVEGG